MVLGGKGVTNTDVRTDTKGKPLFRGDTGCLRSKSENKRECVRVCVRNRERQKLHANRKLVEICSGLPCVRDELPAFTLRYRTKEHERCA